MSASRIINWFHRNDDDKLCTDFVPQIAAPGCLNSQPIAHRLPSRVDIMCLLARESSAIVAGGIVSHDTLGSFTAHDRSTGRWAREVRAHGVPPARLLGRLSTSPATTHGAVVEAGPIVRDLNASQSPYRLPPYRNLLLPTQRPVRWPTIKIGY